MPKMTSRRTFIQRITAAGSAPFLYGFSSRLPRSKGKDPSRYDKIDKALALPVLKTNFFDGPVRIAKVTLLEHENSFICKVTSSDGAEGLSISNNLRMEYLHPIFTKRIAPFFIGKDALDLDRLIEDVYKYKSNYKFQSYALWVPVATVEFAILDMLGKRIGKPIGKLIGEIHNPEPKVYLPTRFRHLSPEKSIAETKRILDATAYKAVKFKIGEKMGGNSEKVKGRSEQIIAMARKEFGDDIWLGVDANGGYDVKEAIRIGNILEDYDYAMYEEPLPFDWYHATQEVADALKVPIAGGEQEASMRNFRWMLGDDILQIVRPDMFYFGGMLRSIKVARMADSVGVNCIPHLSGSGVGYLYAMHFLSAIPNGGAYNPCTKNTNDPLVPVYSDSSSLNVENGKFKVPTGPGLGVEIDPGFLKKHKVIN